MKRNPENTKKHFLYLLISFLIPFLGISTVFIIKYFQFYPSADFSVLYSDMYHQYYPFFSAFRRSLLRGDSLLFTWNVGMGGDYLGLISYYLASPFNLLSILVPENWVLQYFVLLIPVKLGLAGLSFSLLLKNLFSKSDFSLPLFSGFYALCAWSLGYYWNVMWLDSFAVFPLVILGTVRLLKDKQYILYTVSLFFSLCFNYYIGFYICIFIFLLFFCYQICCWKNAKIFFNDFIRIAFFSLLAIGMAAFLELPAFLSLFGAQATINTFSQELPLHSENITNISTFLNAMRRTLGNLNGGLQPTFMEGLPNLYCGIGITFLAALYITSHDIRLKEKLCSLFLLIFMHLSFVIPHLDYVLNGFHFTGMLPYRYSFLYSFVLIIMAYKAWIRRKSFKLHQLLSAAVFSIGILLCSDELFAPRTWILGSSILEIPAVYLYNSIFVFSYIILFLWPLLSQKIKSRQESSTTGKYKLTTLPQHFIFYFLCIAELAALLSNFCFYLEGTTGSNYPLEKEHMQAAVQYTKSRPDNPAFFRSETTHFQTLNDCALNDYYGISAFTSSANLKVIQFMNALGFAGDNMQNRYIFEEGSPVSNLFLNLKYMIEREGRDRHNFQFENIWQSGPVHILENKTYLPLGFLTMPELQTVQFQSSDHSFDFQNHLLSAASGYSDPVWYRLPGKARHIQTEGTEYRETDQPGEYLYRNASNQSAKLTLQFTADREGYCCVRLSLPQLSFYSICINGKEQYNHRMIHPQMLAVGDVRPGDLVEIVIHVPQQQQAVLFADAAILDTEAFMKHYNALSQCPMEVTVFQSDFIEGAISCSHDGLLYTSIPQNGNWHTIVDGKSAETTLVGNCMLAVPLTEGTHTLRFQYQNPAFSLGFIISLLSAGIFLAVCILRKK